MKRFFRLENPLEWLRHTKIFNRVHPTKVFASILSRERDRANRTGQGFSVAVFEVGNGKGKTDAARVLVPILTRRIRSTDSIGWLLDGRIGTILPHTSPENAWLFVGNILNAYRDTDSPPECTVYIYPSPDLPGAEGSSGNKPRHGETRPVVELESIVMLRIPAWKRAVDIVGSVSVLVLSSPLLLLVAFLIKVVSPGPVLFRQERIGHLGRKFSMVKFRTMHRNADTVVHRDHLTNLIRNEIEMTKLDHEMDSRIIPFGNLLRATCIDELPQLLNVLRGDMSLIGPRPCLPFEAREYQPWQMGRFATVPGMTGLWQVSGKNRTTFKQMVRMDIGYARKRGFLLDAMILLKTIPAIIAEVTDLRSSTAARPKELSAVMRLGALIFAIVAVHSSRR